VRSQLQRILASSAFANAERGSRFLQFVVEAALDGRAGEIKEYVIGVDVLGRSPSFDPKTDPIVRVEAGRLRARLNLFYQSEATRDAVLISLPKGGYVPEFSVHHLPRSSGKAKHPAALLFGGALLGLAVSALLLSYFRRAPEARDTVRLSIIPPRGAVIEQFAISPDGKQIAFSAVAAGRLQLWLRALDSLEANEGLARHGGRDLPILVARRPFSGIPRADYSEEDRHFWRTGPAAMPGRTVSRRDVGFCGSDCVRPAPERSSLSDSIGWRCA
jgi:hypothetical protein